MQLFSHPNARRRHRHTVVAPLCALALVLSMYGSDGHDLAASTIADPQYHGTSQLFTTEGPLTLTWGDTRVTGWAGSFHLTGDDVLTVSAITTPVLVERGDARMLVPVTMQWRVPEYFPSIDDADLELWIALRAFLPLPESFLMEQLTLAADQQPSAQGAANSLDDALRNGDAAMAQTLLREEQEMTVERRARLLGVAVLHDVPLETTLLPDLLHDERLRMLSAIHPALEGAHWLLDNAVDDSDEDRLLRLWMLPIADRGANAFAAPTVGRWGEALSGMLYEQEDPSQRAKAFLGIARGVAALHSASGHPERARSYGDAFYAALKPFEALFTEEESAWLGDLRESEAYLIEPVLDSPEPEPKSEPEPKPKPSAPPTPPAPAMNPDDAVARARQDLSFAGVMFTSDTAFKANGTAVAVANAVLATPAGDRFYNFTYDVAARSVGNIADDGAAYPYALPLERFIEWVRTGE